MRSVPGVLEQQSGKLTATGKERHVKAVFVERNNVAAVEPISCTNSADSQSSLSLIHI